MKKNITVLRFLAFAIITIGLVACESEFSNLESDVLNSDVATHFDVKRLSLTHPEFAEVVTYNKPLGPVQTNNTLGQSTLGIYDDDYGRVNAQFVSQVGLVNYEPTFGDDVQIDSVILKLPYYSSVSGVDEDSNVSYNVDSIIPEANDNGIYKPLRLRIFESNYFIRNFNPNADFNDMQAYFSNKSASASELIAQSQLESNEIQLLSPEGGVDVNHNSLSTDGTIKLNTKGYILTKTQGEGEEETTTVTRQAPGIRLKLATDYWQQKIIEQEGMASLSNATNLSEYFRGLYFKTEAVNNAGSYLILNTNSQLANITIYYTRLSSASTEDNPIREEASTELRFTGNKINFFETDYTISIPNGNATDGDSRLYLKGGEGAVAGIKLFNGNEDTFNAWKNFFVETDSEGKFEKSKRLVNEANLIVYVDQNAVNGNEPERLFLYDASNNTPLIDYFADARVGNFPSISAINHLGPLQRENDEADGQGVKYKFKITQHINNILLRDSTNVEIGLSNSLNVNLEEVLQQDVLNTDNKVPISSILTPRGTILHGNNTDDTAKKVVLEIYDTEPNEN